MSDEASSVNSEGVVEPFHVSRVPWEEFARGERFGMRDQHPSSFSGGTQISVSIDVLAPA